MFALDWVTRYLSIGPRPRTPADWTMLRDNHVTLVIDLNNDPVEQRHARTVGLEYVGLRLPDPTEPEQFLTVFPEVHEWVERAWVQNGRVYLHCTAGQSRSPTCAMAHLMATGQGREQAKRLVQNAHEPTWATGDIETLERTLVLWEKQLARKASAP